VATPRSAHILIVDPDPELSNDLSRQLEGGGYRCLHARSAADVFDRIGDARIDAALISAVLPDLPGAELGDLIMRTLGFRIPVLLMGEDDSSEAMARLFRDGPVCFIRKPVHFNLLLYHLERTLAQERADREP